MPLVALITVSSCKSEAPQQPPPPKVQAVSTTMAEFTEGVDTVSTLEASNLGWRVACVKSKRMVIAYSEVQDSDVCAWSTNMREEKVADRLHLAVNAQH